MTNAVERQVDIVEKYIDAKHCNTGTDHNRSWQFLGLHFFDHSDGSIQNQEANRNFNAFKCIGNDGQLQKIIQEHGNQIDDHERWKNHA